MVKTSKIFKELSQKYKLIFLHEASLQRKGVLSLNKLQIYLSVFLFTLLVFMLGVFVARYSGGVGIMSKPMVGGSGATQNDRKEIIELNERILELESTLASNEEYIENIRSILKGNAPEVPLDTVVRKDVVKESEIDVMPTKAEKEFRETVDAERFISFQTPTESIKNRLLFTPIKGVITAGYDASENHLAVDIAAAKGEPVKAADDGTVIFADWTPETGHVIILRHDDGVISIYKHNETLFKKIGDLVEQGEVIAAVGNTGELSTGPHLHFELWIDGKATNPETYIDF